MANLTAAMAKVGDEPAVAGCMLMGMSWVSWTSLRQNFLGVGHLYEKHISLPMTGLLQIGHHVFGKPEAQVLLAAFDIQTGSLPPPLKSQVR